MDMVTKLAFIGVNPTPEITQTYTNYTRTHTNSRTPAKTTSLTLAFYEPPRRHR